MEKTFEEIASIIKGGPISGKEIVFQNVLDIILSCTTDEEAKKHFSESFMKYVLKFMGPDSPYNHVVYKILINIFSDETVCLNLCSCRDLMSNIVDLSIGDIIDNKSNNADLSCMLLANVTRNLDNCEKIIEYMSPFSVNLHKIVSAFTNVSYNQNCSLNQLSMVLCNLSQLVEVRKIITQTNDCMLQKLIPFMKHENVTRRRGLIGLVHNCAFDSSLHDWMLSDEIDILPLLLLPLAGPEQFDDEDNDKLPIDLQYLSDTKTRESDPEIRKQLLETLNQLCATKSGRQYLRDHNAYVILRELHKWEKDSPALLACENVVDILIRTEDEIGIDHLKNVDIPADLEVKFNKELTD